jgi:hypothetical protein
MGQTSDFPEGYVPFWPNIVANMVLYSVAVLIILVGVHIVLVRSKGLVPPMAPDPGEEGESAGGQGIGVPSLRDSADTGVQRP